jgi:hypothetical protein
MYIQPNRIISLGYGRFVRSDEIVAIEPIIAGRGPGRRSLVWIRGIEAPMVSSRTEEAILSDLIRPEHEAVKTRYQRAVLKSVVDTLDSVPGALRRRLRDAAGVDLDQLAEDAAKAIA